jgi:hypothetical protein
MAANIGCLLPHLLRPGRIHQPYVVARVGQTLTLSRSDNPNRLERRLQTL